LPDPISPSRYRFMSALSITPKSAPAKTAASGAHSDTRSERAATAAPELDLFLSDLVRVI